MGAAGGMYGGGGAVVAGGGGGGGAVVARGPNNAAACCVAPGEDCTACGVACGGGGAGTGAMSYVGCGQGEYVQETTYKYVGCGGDFDAVRPRRDFTCLITTGCLLSLLLLIPLLCWLLSGTTTELYDCEAGFMNWESAWSQVQQEYCCTTTGRGCATTQPATAVPTLPPTPPPTRPTPVGPVDPFNCAVDAENTWAADKKEW